MVWASVCGLGGLGFGGLGARCRKLMKQVLLLACCGFNVGSVIGRRVFSTLYIP